MINFCLCAILLFADHFLLTLVFGQLFLDHLRAGFRPLEDGLDQLGHVVLKEIRAFINQRLLSLFSVSDLIYQLIPEASSKKEFV